MFKRLLVLGGISIFLVPVYHASGYGFFAMFQWTDRYLPVSVPNYDQVGSLAFYVIVLIQQLSEFALPAFMFISGFFLAFAAGGERPTLRWKVVLARVKTMSIPLVLWTAIFFLFFLRRLPADLDELFDRYYYVVLLCQYYLIAPYIIAFAKNNWKIFLVVAALLDFGRFGLRYLDFFGIGFPGQQLLISLSPKWLLPNLFFWFALGMVGGFRQQPFVRWLRRWRWVLLITTIILAVLTMVEYQILARIAGEGWLGPYFGGVSRKLYAFFFVMAFLAFENLPIPFSDAFSNLGVKTLGIYLVHSRLMYIVAVILYRYLPWILGNQLLYQLLLILAGLGGTLLLMEVVKRTPARRAYRYIFG